MNAAVNEEKKPLRLDLGCGPNPKEGHLGVDVIAYNDNVLAFDLRHAPWPWESSSVDSAHCSHFLEHLTNLNEKWERVIFFNELYRVMKPGGQCQLIIPHWASNRYYGDPTHKEPFSEMGFYYLDPNWRKVNAPHTDVSNNRNGYNCYWNCTWGYSLHPEVNVRGADYQKHAMAFFKEACQDIICTMTANK